MKRIVTGALRTGPAPDVTPKATAGAAEAHAPRTPGDVPERNVFYVLSLLAVAALVLSFVLNWLWAPELVTTAAGEGAASRIARYKPSSLPALSKSPRLLLPSDVTAYETIESHMVPGSGDRAAEAVYQTYNVTLGMTAKTTVYGRVEGFSTASEARERAQEIMKPYSFDRKTLRLEPGVSAQAGFDRVANGTPMTYSVVWVSDTYVTWIKTFFQDNPLGTEVMAKKFLLLTGDPVYRTAAVFQRLGIQGAAANTYIHRNDKPVKQPKKKTTGAAAPDPVAGTP